MPIGPIEVLEDILTRLLGERRLIEPNMDKIKLVLWSDAGTPFKCWKLLSFKEIVYGHFELCSLALKMTSSKRFFLDVLDMVQASGSSMLRRCTAIQSSRRQKSL